MGTAGFLAPEVIDGRPAGPASDRYALAAVAFEALTGRAALRGRRRAGDPLRPRQPRRPAGLVAAPRPVGAASTRPCARPRQGPPRAARDGPRAGRLPPGRGRGGPAAGRRRAAVRGRAWRPPWPRSSPRPAPRAGAGADHGRRRRRRRPPAPLPSASSPSRRSRCPAPGGRELPAHPAAPDDLPGLAGIRGAAAADVGERAGGLGAGRRGRSSRPPPTALSGPACGSSRSTSTGPGGAGRRSPIDIVGTMDRWALVATPGGHVVLVRGHGEAPEDYAASL